MASMDGNVDDEDSALIAGIQEICIANNDDEDDHHDESDDDIARVIRGIMVENGIMMP